ncbi:bifunctional 4-hydroxy-2-oxoglutarate aldolase/2-dehydro-3-deoxy-phosphogluconate aldolase [Gracilinema caldarium]|uniref:bifunctional 4-hydroxy-2-oxoglutarate aldolase/2-dehydro-3-deoxy-phosphogluconate aldolase n=1 Tax=Gracilinema caldarium TaxID=215591 RepID=UPI0026EF4D3A|nr:bifunctional 4-hydroxy-2-oxoglutarate aldolase/2-dehydro-3-deoxy-phosphogluconate aldolase [Gracilinema caldarium]
MESVFEKIQDIGLVPVITIEDPKKAVPLGRALIAGGIPVAEITFRTLPAEESIRRLHAECPELIVGAGTIINRNLAERARNAGAQFVVSPGFNASTIEYCRSQGLPIIPGANNPSIIEAGLELGIETFKFFPAEASGGPAMVKSLSAPFSSIKFVPTGGIDLENIGSYARIPSVAAIGGSWMVKEDLIANEQWDKITALCIQSRLALQGFAFAHIGINETSDAEAQTTASFFNNLGFTIREGTSSIFSGQSLEIMKSPGRGTKGHLALSCNNVERALTYLGQFGFAGVEETAKYEKGRLKVIYLDKEIGGFAVHLVKN